MEFDVGLAQEGGVTCSDTNFHPLDELGQCMKDKLLSMMNILKCCLVGILVAGSVAAAPQSPDSGGTGHRRPNPAGGTPEPASMLLLAGGALAYGGLRHRKRSKKNVPKED
ncbi:MAG: hypothetical protein ACI91B_003947 [Planctomycetota bacterium]